MVCLRAGGTQQDLRLGLGKGSTGSVLGFTTYFLNSFLQD